MKLLILSLFISSVAFGAYSNVRDATSTAIPAAYTTAGAELLTGVRANHMCCQNFTGAPIGVCMSASGAAACTDDWYIASASGSGFCFDFHALANSIFVKGWSGVVNTGIFQCRAWMKN